MGTYNFNVTYSVTDNATVGLGSYSGSPIITSTINGTCTNVYSGTITASTAQTYDVTSGLTNAYGSALVYTSVQQVVIKNTHATASLVVGGGTNPLFGSSEHVTIDAGTCVVLGAVPVTVDSTHKVITITPSASCTYQIIIIG